MRRESKFQEGSGGGRGGVSERTTIYYETTKNWSGGRGPLVSNDIDGLGIL